MQMSLQNLNATTKNVHNVIKIITTCSICTVIMLRTINVNNLKSGKNSGLYIIILIGVIH